MKSYFLLKKEIKPLTRAACAAAKTGMEICGLLVDNGFFLEILQVKNKSRRPGHFEFYSREIDLIEKAVKRLNHEIVGTFHSHPFSSAEPGNSDIENSIEGEIMLIIDASQKALGLWKVTSKKKTKLRFNLLG